MKIHLNCKRCGKAFVCYNGNREVFCSLTCSKASKREAQTVRIDGDIAYINVRGVEVAIDIEDVEKVKNILWCIKSSSRVHYVHSNGHSTMHRLIMGVTGKHIIIDHIDNDGLNNRKSNLRIVTQPQNARNSRKCLRPTSSKYKGVYFSNTHNTWIACIKCDKKKYFLGRFAIEEDAARAYDKGAISIHKEFAKLNFPTALIGRNEE